MTPHKGLVPDANILLHAVFGQPARELLQAFEDAAAFYSPISDLITPEDISPTSRLAAGKHKHHQWLTEEVWVIQPLRSISMLSLV